MLGAGFTRETIASEFRAVADLTESCEAIPTSSSENYRVMTRVCGLVRDWCWEPEYSDRTTGEPRLLRLDDHGSDLRSLITNRFPDRQVDDILLWMERNGVIARQLDGSYRLIRRAVLVDEYHHLAIERMATMATQYLETALYNLRTPESRQRYLDRTSWVFDLPQKYVPQFQDLVREQAQAFLEVVDEWLESRIVRGSEEPTVQAGVHTYMYAGTLGKVKVTGRDATQSVPVQSGRKASPGLRPRRKRGVGR